MARFKDAEEVYATIGKLLRELAADEVLGPRFRQADTVIRFDYSDPDAQITASLRSGEEERVDFGATDLEPQVTMTSTADTAHRFWLGRLNVTIAIARGEIKTEGPAEKILALVPLSEPSDWADELGESSAALLPLQN